MPKMTKLFLMLLLATLMISAQDKKYVAVTFDDMPFAHQSMCDAPQQLELVKKIVSYLEEYNIPAIGFVNEGKMFDKEGKIDSAKLDILKMWLDAGLELGNHTYSHHDVNKVPFEEYTQDILKGEQVTRPLAEERGIEYKYFRHPYLRSGATQEARIALEEFLKENNYKVAPVTIDNSEWVYAYGYNMAYNDKDTVMMIKIGTEYVDYMIGKIKYWEDQSQKLFGRNIKQVLLIHSNLLNSEYFDELAKAMQDYGYNYISLDEVLEDPAYQSENTYVGTYGPSWIHRWAKTKGVDKSFYEGEPHVPQHMMDYTGLDFE